MYFWLASWKLVTTRAGSGSVRHRLRVPGSVPKCHGSTTTVHCNVHWIVRCITVHVCTEAYAECRLSVTNVCRLRDVYFSWTYLFIVVLLSAITETVSCFHIFWLCVYFVRIRVVDPYSFLRIRIQSLMLEANTDPDPDPIRIQGFNDQKLKKNYSWKFF